MMITVFILASMITGGSIGSFIDFPSHLFDDGLIQAVDTPGGDDWYLPVSRVDVPCGWVVTRNGVVTNVAPPQVLPADPGAEIWEPSYYWRIVPGGVAPGETLSYSSPEYLKWRPGSFDIAWEGIVNDESCNDCDAKYYAWATNSEVVTLERPMYMSKTFRSTGKHASAVLALPFEAYYERLYYASKTGDNKFDTGNWGPSEACADFPFNNSLSTPSGEIKIDAYLDFVQGGETNRHVKATRRMIGDTIVNLAQLKGRLDAMLTDSPLTYNNPAFIYRPGWITDANNEDGDSADPFEGWYYPELGCRNWWSSKDSKLNITDSLIPLFEWRSDPTVLGGWKSNCVTLAMLYPSENFSMGGENPLRKVVEAVNFGDMSRIDYVFERNTYDMTLEMAMTNVFPRSAQMELDQSLPSSFELNKLFSFDKYSPKRRLNIRNFTGVNQILSCMDRTIHFPYVLKTQSRVRTVNSRMKTYAATIIANYEEGVGLTVKTKLDDIFGYGFWSPVTNSMSSYSFYAGETTGLLYFFVQHNDFSSSGGGSVSSANDIYLTESTMTRVAELFPSSDTEFDIRLIAVEDNLLYDKSIRLAFESSNATGMVKGIDIPFEPSYTEFLIPVEYTAITSYEFESTLSNKINIGQVHLPGDGDDRAENCKCGIMSGLMLCVGPDCSDYLGYQVYDGDSICLYKTQCENYSSRSELRYAIKNACDDIEKQFRAESTKRMGCDYLVIDTMIDYPEPPTRGIDDIKLTPNFDITFEANLISNAVWTVSPTGVITPKDLFYSLPFKIGVANLTASIDISNKHAPSGPKEYRPDYAGYGKTSQILSTDWVWNTLRKD